MPRLEQDVLGLDVPVHDVLSVGVRQGVGHVASDPHQPMAQRLALDERHDVEEQAVRDARIEQRQDVGVGETGRHLDLAEEAVGAQAGAELGP